jgi:hypothetical protein
VRIVAHTQQNKQVELDLFGDEQISIKYEVDNIREANSKNSSYSKSYDIPATQNNNKFFRHIYDLQSDMKGVPQAVLNAFNPYKSCDVEIYAEGSLILEGIMFLNSIKEKEGEHTYNVTVYSSSIGLLNALGEATISDLDFEDIEHDKTIANIQASFTGGVTLTGGGTSNAVFYPLIDDGLIGYSTLGAGALDINSSFNMPPCIQMHYLVNKIFDFAGFEYNSTFLDSNEFKNIYMDSSTNNEYSVLTEYGDVVAHPSADYTIPNNGAFNDLIHDTETADANNLHNTTTGVYTAPADNLEVSATCSLFVDNSNSSARTIQIRLVHNSSAANQAPSTIIHTQVIPGNASNVQVFAFANVMINSGETIKFTVGTTGVGLSIEDLFAVGGQTLRSRYYFYTNTRSDGGYIFQHNRRDVKLADIIKDLTKMFNLIIEPNEFNGKRLNIEPYDDYIAGGVEHNWSDKVDRSEMTQQMFSLPSKLLFAMAKDDDDYYLKLYENIVGKEYGSQEVLIDAQTDVVEEIRLDVFAPTAVVDMHPDFEEISVITSSEDGVVFERFSNAPRLLFKNYATHNASLGIFDQFNSLYQGTFGAQVTPYATAHQYEDTTSALVPAHSDLTFGSVGALFAALSSIPTNTFYNKYWFNYIQERYVNLSHLLKVRINLKPKDISKFSFADRVRIDNQVYRVNSIDYTTGNERLAKVELYRIH